MITHIMCFKRWKDDDYVDPKPRANKNEEKMSTRLDKGDIIKAGKAISSPYFWAYLSLVHKLSWYTEKFSRWHEGCPCHGITATTMWFLLLCWGCERFPNPAQPSTLRHQAHLVRNEHVCYFSCKSYVGLECLWQSRPWVLEQRGGAIQKGYAGEVEPAI